MNRCNICLEENCNGKFNCNCDSCDKINECYRILRPTIRITNRCTQECSHCCFSSSPKSDIMMSIDMAKDISKFLMNNDIKILNLMGGEFFCNPNWFEILDVLISTSIHSRLATNGDWINITDERDKLEKLCIKYKDVLSIAVSKDKWHTNKNSDEAFKFLSNLGVHCSITKPEEATDNSIVPIGRSIYSYGVYSMFSCYCDNPVNKYSFLIDEEGEIYKCSFGSISYSNIKDSLNGGFDKVFKEFNKRFYDIFIPSCKRCIRSSNYHGRSVKL